MSDTTKVPRRKADMAKLLEFAERAYVLLDNVTDDDECQFDHHGNCQTHYLERTCSVAAARKLLDDWCGVLDDIKERAHV